MDAKQTASGPRALVNRDALLHNIRIIRERLAPGVKLCAVVKADAYGHGADVVVDTLLRWAHRDMEPPVVNMLAVACFEEAAALGDVDVPILVFRPVENGLVGRQRAELEAAIRAGWLITLCTSSGADDVARVAMNLGKRAKVHIKLDTGMSRWGATSAELDAIAATITAHPSLQLAGIYTHFACSELHEAESNAQQNGIFRDVLCRMGILPMNHGLEARATVLRHAANSGAAFFNSDAHWDMVRPGIAMYGIDPTGSPSLDRKLRPVMRWVAPLAMVRMIRKGSAIGYGQTFIAERDMRVGLVPVGYADGYMRAWSNKAVMMVAGQPAPVVGRVSMDLTTIDLTDHPGVNTGDEVVLMDDDPLSPGSAYALAKLAGTIPYEIFCRIGQRVTRVAAELPKAAAHTRV